MDIRGREILDSRGNPTVEVDVTLETGASGRAANTATPPPIGPEAAPPDRPELERAGAATATTGAAAVRDLPV